MIYAQIDNCQIIKYPVDVRCEHPNTSMRDEWPGGEIDGLWYVVVVPVQPVYDPDTQFVTEITPQYLNGEWRQTWVVEDLSREALDLMIAEKKAALFESLKSRRDSLLAKSDFTQLSDAPYNINKREWATYRQSLRTLPDQFEDNFALYGFDLDKYFPSPPDNPPKTTIPQSVSPFQAKAALLESGLLNVVETTMESADPMTRLAWNTAQEFLRNSPTVENISGGLNLGSEQLDNLFTLASTIRA